MAKKAAIIGSSVVLLVAVVAIVAVTVSSNKPAEEPTATSSSDHLQTSTSIKTVCKPTDYRETCESSLQKVVKGETNDPKELISAAFNITEGYLSAALEKSSTLHEAAKDPKTQAALQSCKEMLNHAKEDLRASLNKFADMGLTNVDEVVADLQSWLAAVYTYQDSCLDNFENISSPAAASMAKALNSSMELTSNANVMVNQVQKLFKDFNFDSFTTSRKLLSSEIPQWVSSTRRRLLSVPLTQLAPNVTVAADGTGQFTTIKQALAKVPKKNVYPFVIKIKAGTYKEKIVVEKYMTNVVFVGDGATKTIITYGSNFEKEGTKTSKTATVAVEGPHFMARDIGFENSAGPEGHQAVALRVNSDLSVIYNCRMDGYQDTLYTQNYRQYIRDSTITGTIDFIFGNALVVLQNCEIFVRKPLSNQQNMVTAQGRVDRNMATGIILHNCTIKADPSLAAAPEVKSYLGRPWKAYARTVFVQSYIDGFISPEGYTPWIDGATMKPVNMETCYYAEAGNTGPGADMGKRVKWPGVKKIDLGSAEMYSVGKFIQGDTWLPATGVPFNAGFSKN